MNRLNPQWCQATVAVEASAPRTHRKVTLASASLHSRSVVWTMMAENLVSLHQALGISAAMGSRLQPLHGDPKQPTRGSKSTHPAGSVLRTSALYCLALLPRAQQLKKIILLVVRLHLPHMHEFGVVIRTPYFSSGSSWSVGLSIPEKD